MAMHVPHVPGCTDVRRAEGLCDILAALHRVQKGHRPSLDSSAA